MKKTITGLDLPKEKDILKMSKKEKFKEMDYDIDMDMDDKYIKRKNMKKSKGMCKNVKNLF